MTTTTDLSITSALRRRSRSRLSPEEMARRQVRRRLLRYIMASHHQRIAERGRTRFESALGGPA